MLNFYESGYWTGCRSQSKAKQKKKEGRRLAVRYSKWHLRVFFVSDQKPISETTHPDTVQLSYYIVKEVVIQFY